jgi:hypothetical protein
LAKAGETVNVPTNAPHAFRNASSQAARLLCVCTPPGQEAFFSAVGLPWQHGPKRHLCSARMPRLGSSPDRTYSHPKYCTKLLLP